MKALFTIVILMFAGAGISQTAPIFGNSKADVHASSLQSAVDTLSITSLETLGKMTPSGTFTKTDKINPLPQNFNWSCDLKKLENYKYMALDFHSKDINGRDLPVDMQQEVVKRIYYYNVQAQH